jgi:N-acetylglucosaminyl-diphospho-decaprenol L-rhamnosyltransferase
VSPMLAPDSPEVPRLSAVIVSYNTRDALVACVSSLEHEVTLPFEAIVVDNASGDQSAEAVVLFHPLVRVVRNAENRGFGAACNQGLRLSRAPYALLLNSDAEVRAGTVETLVSILDAQPGVALAGPRTLNADGTVQLSFGPDLTPRNEWAQKRRVEGIRRRDPEALRAVEELAGQDHEPAWLSGSCLLARRSALESVGLFDERFFLYEEDVDLCLRLRKAGWRLVFASQAEVFHRLGASMATAPARSRLEYHRSHLSFYRKHHGALLTGLLRLWMVASGALGWIRSRATPNDRPEDSAGDLDLLRLGLRGR